MSYVYDSANQLVRENNGISGKTRTWTYDNAGNILNRKEYAYTTGTLGAVQDTISYTYGDSSWGDLLTKYDGVTITLDAIGNPLSDGTWSYTWQHGRQLATMSNGTTAWSFTYNADGLRTKRSNGSTTYSYVYNGDRLSQMTVGSDTLSFSYDAGGIPMAVQYKGTTYYYATNIQGDVVAILNGSGAAVVEYAYDAWGSHISTTGSMAATLGTANPLRYRSYIYDADTNLYYLQSRYYNPELGRFLNADAFTSTGQGLIGNNMFAYCNNNASNCSDLLGMRPVSILERFGDTSIPAPPSRRKETMRDVTIEINSALNPKRQDAMLQRRTNDLLFDVIQPRLSGLCGIFIEIIEAVPLYFEFYNAVNHKEEWDIKRKDPWEKTIGTSFPGFDTKVLYKGSIMTPEDLGNYTYGSIGRAYRFPLVILYAGSYYAAGFPTGEDFWGNEWKDWGYITKGYFG